ncbi:polysaccharide biosynthesis/export family protein [Fimbriiglobus ruber]|uniref:Putative polysaccharide export protein n=1 Tax=Fimbriiglobus ruber TaxID=1908690 RepID=A0A225DN87_9BACT|nr:polysaccharide biosynthesis/export family protein [Fimbriiglobus ruber]OWK37647.1 putative polysaccharide export protein [Fimbriiglobus ruber]
MTGARGWLGRAAFALLAGLGLIPAGCMTPGGPLAAHTAANTPPIVVPPPGTVARELDKITLPEYVIEPPDVLVINAVILFRPDPKKKDIVDLPEIPAPGDKAADKDKGGKEKSLPPDKLNSNEKLYSLPIQPVWGEYTVRPDGTVFLGVYGSVQVAGYTLRQAAAAIRESLAKQVFPDAEGVKRDSLLVVLDVTQYNSKKYYVILDGGGYGEQVIPIPIMGSETVLDALGNVYGLPAVASKRNIWVARRTPHVGQPEQILPVDWVGITQHGVTQTNYQIMPGDRVYVKAQRIIAFDTTLARIISPIERVLGITLLGSSTVNQIGARGPGF